MRHPVVASIVMAYEEHERQKELEKAQKQALANQAMDTTNE